MVYFGCDAAPGVAVHTKALGDGRDKLVRRKHPHHHIAGFFRKITDLFDVETVILPGLHDAVCDFFVKQGLAEYCGKFKESRFELWFGVLHYGACMLMDSVESSVFWGWEESVTAMGTA